MIEIIDYLPEHQSFFEKYNKQWISEFYDIEEVDEYVLGRPDDAILKPGGAILIALYNGEVAGTVALRKIDEETYEFTKMVVDPDFRRKGIGEAISYASFEKAKALGSKYVILYSNRLQTAAICLYEKLGFKHLEVENAVYKRANVKMIIDLQNELQAQP